MIALYYYLIKVLTANKLGTRTEGSFIQYTLIIIFHCHAFCFLNYFLSAFVRLSTSIVCLSHDIQTTLHIYNGVHLLLIFVALSHVVGFVFLLLSLLLWSANHFWNADSLYDLCYSAMQQQQWQCRFNECKRSLSGDKKIHYLK